VEVAYRKVVVVGVVLWNDCFLCIGLGSLQGTQMRSYVPRLSQDALLLECCGGFRDLDGVAEEVIGGDAPDSGEDFLGVEDGVPEIKRGVDDNWAHFI